MATTITCDMHGEGPDDLPSAKWHVRARARQIKGSQIEAVVKLDVCVSEDCLTKATLKALADGQRKAKDKVDFMFADVVIERQ